MNKERFRCFYCKKILTKDEVIWHSRKGNYVVKLYSGCKECVKENKKSINKHIQMKLELLDIVFKNRFYKKLGYKYRFFIFCDTHLVNYIYYNKSNMTDFKICLLKHLIRERT